MKKLLFSIILCLVFVALSAQVPQGFNYQAIARDGSGNPIINTDLQVRISILSDTAGFYTSGAGTYVWEEQHTVTTNSFGVFTLAIGTGVKQQGSAETFSVIPWKTSQLFIGIKINYPTWKQLGSARLWSVPYSLVANDFGGSKLKVKGNEISNDSVLFEVKNNTGQTIFAVYNEGVRIFVEDGAKGKKGGFAIGGFGAAKAGESQPYFIVNSDSIRAYIDSNQGKGIKGGFAIGGYGGAKGSEEYYLSLLGKSTVDTITNASQIMWYPRKEAFLAGRIDILHPDSVGMNSFSTGYKTKAIGNFSHAMGYESIARGANSTAIGRSAIAGINSFALGNFSKALGDDSYAIGSASRAEAVNSIALGVGSRSSGLASLSFGFQSVANKPYAVAIGYHATASGQDSYAIGSYAEANGAKSFAIGSYGLNEDGSPTSRPTWTPGLYSLAFGMGAQATNIGAMSLGVNTSASGLQSAAIGFGTNATNQFATAMGYKASANGVKSIAIGAHYQLTFNRLVWEWSEPLQRWISVEVPTEVNRPTSADDDFSIAIGNGNYSKAGGLSLGTNNNATAFGSVAIGHTNDVIKEFSFAAGYGNYVEGIKAFALGENLSVKSANSFVIGAYNVIEGTTNEWLYPDPLFVIGNGNPVARSNAFVVLKDGNIVLSPNIKEGGGGMSLYYDTNDGLMKKIVSSAKYKSEINPINDISWLYDLRPVSFVYNNDIRHSPQYGLIAEEMEPVNKNLVVYLEGKPEGINYNGLIAPIVKALQDHKKLIEDLNARNESLSVENAELRSRLEKLENAVTLFQTNK